MQIEDRLDLLELVGRYIHLVDDAAWDRLDEVFTDDAVCDYSDFVPSMPVMDGLNAIHAQFSGMEHPIAHLATNTVIEGPGPDEHVLRSKLLIVMRDRRIYVGEYRDLAVRTSVGWRFRRRESLRPRALKQDEANS